MTARARRAQAKLLEEQGSVYHADLRERARACAIGALALSRRTGDPAAIADALLLLGHLEPADGFPERRRHALAQEALVHARRAADPRLVAGLAAPFAGELDAAQSAFEQQLRICRQLVIPWLASEGLAGLAAIATRHGEPDRAAHLFGAAAAHGPVGDADVIARLEHRFFASASQDYGDRPWHQARTAGAELAFTDAIDFALDTAASRPITTRTQRPW